MLTRVIYECLVLAFLGGCDQIPDEALYLVIAFVVSQAVNQKSPTQQKGNVMCRTLATANKQLITMIPLTGNPSGYYRIPAACLTYRSPPCLSL